ncbi:MAG: PAS domain-containing protein [Rhizobiales bacterium]|nr:PAS domain-containing protein [Hyphomicrobiales bacterium]
MREGAVSVATGSGGLPAFLAHGGEIGRLIAARDWDRTAIGAVADWPQTLRSMLALILSSNVAQVLLWGPKGLMFYNAGYAEISGARHPSILGSAVLDSWPEIASFNRHVLDVGLAGGALAFEDQHFVLMRNGVAEDAWFDLDYSPVFDERGQPVGVLAIVHETTRRHLAEAEARRNTERLAHALDASGVIGVWDWHLASNQVFADARFASFYSVDAERALYGVPRAELVAAIHPDDRDRIDEDTRRAIEAGGELAFEHRVLDRDGAIRWVMVRGTSSRDEVGRIIRLSGAAVDVTERRQSDEKRRLLVRELHHRIKNTFAVIGGMVTMTGRTAKSVDEMGRLLRGRIVALAQAHELIRPAITAELDSTERTTLPELFAAIITPHLVSPEQLRIDLPAVDVGVGAATSRALVLHELATNASKYGALSSPDGVLTVSGRLAGSSICLDWVESGGPAITGPPPYQGFGSRLASMSITGQLGGELQFHWQESGLKVAILIPEDRISR